MTLSSVKKRVAFKFCKKVSGLKQQQHEAVSGFKCHEEVSGFKLREASGF